MRGGVCLFRLCAREERLEPAGAQGGGVGVCGCECRGARGASRRRARPPPPHTHALGVLHLPRGVCVVLADERLNVNPAGAGESARRAWWGVLARGGAQGGGWRARRAPRQGAMLGQPKRVTHMSPKSSLTMRTRRSRSTKPLLSGCPPHAMKASTAEERRAVARGEGVGN